MMRVLWFAIWGSLFCLLGTLAQAEVFKLPSFAQVRAEHVSSDALLLDRHGAVLNDLRINPHVRRLDWVPLQELSPAMREALLRAEDHRFFEHSGVDWLAFAGAAWQNLWYRHKRGASTLTMQLAGLLDPELRMPAGRGARRSYEQKWDQSRAAIELEHKWSKLQILEAYLNLAPFRGDLQGVGAASELLFGVPASRITASQAALLAVLLRGPNARPALVARRACVLARKLGKGALCGEIRSLAIHRLDAPRNQPRHALAMQLARAYLRHPAQRRVTLLDSAAQSSLLAALRQLDDPQAAAVLLDNETGEIRAWVGAVASTQPDGVKVRRVLPGWDWPVQTALAVDQEKLTLASPLPLGKIVFDPLDVAASTHNWMSLRHALRGGQLGAMAYVRQINDRQTWLGCVHYLGLPEAGLAEQPDIPRDLSLLQLAAIWRTFAAGGLYAPPRLFPDDPVVPPVRVWRAGTAFMLQDLYSGYGAGGWQTAWQIQATDGATVLVGNTDRHTLAVVTHASVRKAGLRILLKSIDMESGAPQMPEGVTSTVVSYDPPHEPARREWFLSGTEIGLVTVLPAGKVANITFPARGARYTVDALPGRRDRWALSAQSSTAVQWFMDGQFLGTGLRPGWQPQPGVHHLSIRDVLDRELDSVDFSVQVDNSSVQQSPEDNENPSGDH